MLRNTTEKHNVAIPEPEMEAPRAVPRQRHGNNIYWQQVKHRKDTFRKDVRSAKTRAMQNILANVEAERLPEQLTLDLQSGRRTEEQFALRYNPNEPIREFLNRVDENPNIYLRAGSSEEITSSTHSFDAEQTRAYARWKEGIDPNEGKEYDYGTGELKHPKGARVHPNEPFELAQDSYFGEPYTSNLFGETFKTGIYRRGVFATEQFQQVGHYMTPKGGIGKEGGEVLRILTGQPTTDKTFILPNEHVISQPQVITTLHGFKSKDRLSNRPVSEFLDLQSGQPRLHAGSQSQWQEIAENMNSWEQGQYVRDITQNRMSFPEPYLAQKGVDTWGDYLQQANAQDIVQRVSRKESNLIRNINNRANLNLSMPTETLTPQHAATTPDITNRRAAEHFLTKEHFDYAMQKGQLTSKIGAMEGIFFSSGPHWRKDSGWGMQHGFFFDPDVLQNKYKALPPPPRLDEIFEKLYYDTKDPMQKTLQDAQAKILGDPNVSQWKAEQFYSSTEEQFGNKRAAQYLDKLNWGLEDVMKYQEKYGLKHEPEFIAFQDGRPPRRDRNRHRRRRIPYNRQNAW